MVKRQSFPLVMDKWDSSFFKTPIARLSISGKKKYPYFSDRLSDLLLRAKREGVRHLFIKLENPKAFYEKSLLHAGMRECGESVDLRFSYPARIIKNDIQGHDISVLRPTDIAKVETIASDAFRLSYFYGCGLAKIKDVDRYHRTWVKNLSKDKDVIIFVAKKNNIITGFLIVKLNKPERYGRIILIAVHKKHRQEGLGSALMRECIERLNSKVGNIFVKTQKDNYKALTLYRKLGFKPVSGEKVFFKKMPLL
jgi:ribosomal protein S18 acetylase RimI-like enzyme